MKSKTIQIGNLIIEFEGNSIWMKKSIINLKAQIEWLNTENCNDFFKDTIHFKYKKSSHNYCEIKNNLIIIGIKNWFDANSSILFQIGAIKNDSIVIHGNCLIKEKDEAYVFAAHGGVGKTSMLIEAIDKKPNKYKFGGDDLVWIDTKRNEVIPYYRPMCIYKYHYNVFDQIFGKRKIRFLKPSIFFRVVNLIKINLEAIIGENFIFNLYQKLNIVPSNRYYLLDPIKFFNINNSNKIKISAINYLEKSKSFSIENVSKEELSNLISHSTENEFKNYIKILNQYCLNEHNTSFQNYLISKVNNSISSQKIANKICTSGNWKIEQIDKICIS